MDPTFSRSTPPRVRWNSKYNDLGIVRLEQGAIAYQPPTVRHAAISCSDDLVIMEVNTPGVIGCRP